MARLADTIEWSKTIYTMDDFKKKSFNFPVLARITSGVYGTSDRLSVYADMMYLIRGWGAQERLVAKNKSGVGLSIPVDTKHKLKHDGGKGVRFKRESYMTSLELNKKYKPPYQAMFDPKESVEIYDESENSIFNLADYGKFTIVDVHHLPYLAASYIDEEGSIYVDAIESIPEFADFGISVAEGVTGHPELLATLIHEYKKATDHVTCTNNRLSSLMGYSKETKGATPQIGPVIERAIQHRKTARHLPLPRIPDGRKKDTFKEVRINRPAIPIPQGSSSSLLNTIQTPSIPVTKQGGSPIQGGSNPPIYDDATSAQSPVQARRRLPKMFDDRVPEPPTIPPRSPATPCQVFPPKLATLADENCQVPLPLPSKASELNDLAAELKRALSIRSLKNTDSSYDASGTQPNSPHSKVAFQVPKYPKSPSQIMTLQRAESEISHSGERPNLPVAKIPPFHHDKPALPLKPWRSSDVVKYNKRVSEPLIGNPPLVEHVRERLTSAPEESLQKGKQLNSVIHSISDIPDDITNLDVSDVGACLQVLNLGEFVDEFTEKLVDGNLLNKMDLSDFQSLGMSGINARKMLEFVGGWRPKIQAS